MFRAVARFDFFHFRLATCCSCRNRLILLTSPELFPLFCEMARLLVGDNNLTRFWAAFQVSRPALKHSRLVTATDLDALDSALSQTETEDREQVIISVLTSILLDEVNQLEVENSAFAVFEQTVSRLIGLCPQRPSCQVFMISFLNGMLRSFIFWCILLHIYLSRSFSCISQFFLAPPEQCILPRWYSAAYPKIYQALVRLVPQFPPNLQLLPIYKTDFTMFEPGLDIGYQFIFSMIHSFLYFCSHVLGVLIFLFSFRWPAFQVRVWQGFCGVSAQPLRPVDGRAREVCRRPAGFPEEPDVLASGSDNPLAVPPDQAGPANQFRTCP